VTFIPKRRWAKPTLPIDPQPLFIVPIRKEEPCLFPDNLLDEPPPELGGRSWWVVYTKSRQEKALSRELFKYGIPFYLPQIKNTTLVRGRHRTTFMPLFAGYVFMLANEAERVRGLTTNRVSRMLPVDDAEQLIADMRQIKRLIESNAPLTIARPSGADQARLDDGHRRRRDDPPRRNPPAGLHQLPPTGRVGRSSRLPTRTLGLIFQTERRNRGCESEGSKKSGCQ
jgi:hypothetical protein